MILETELEGALSKKPIKLKFMANERAGIDFCFLDGTKLEAHHKNIFSATRNTVLGNQNHQICFVEHLLAALNLLGIDRMKIEVYGSEIPLDDGSSKIWLELLNNWPDRQEIKPIHELRDNLSVSDELGRVVLAYPSGEFKLTYLFKSPINGVQSWTSWTKQDGIKRLGHARTFAKEEEHKLLGLCGKMLSYNQTGFDLPLHSEDEPALHKLLDLLGDLSLCGLNPLSIKAHFISLQGGHLLNSRMCESLIKHGLSAALS